MHSRRIQTLAATIFVASLVIAVPVLADEIRGKIKSIDRAKSEIVVTDEKTETRRDGQSGFAEQGPWEE